MRKVYGSLFILVLLLTVWTAAWAGKLDMIRSRGEITVGVLNATAPFGFEDEMTSRLQGFDVDLARAIAEALGVRAVFKIVSTSDRLNTLVQGSVDMLVAGMHHTWEADEVIDFSISYFKDGQRMLVPAGSGIRSIADINGKRVAVARGTTAGVNVKKVQPNANLQVFEGYPQAFLAVKDGSADIMVADSVILQGLRNSDDTPDNWKIVGELLSSENYAIGVPENASDLRDAVNKALADMWRNGTYRVLYKKWFGEDTNYSVPLQWKMQVWP